MSQVNIKYDISKNVYYRKGFKYQVARVCVLQSTACPSEDIITDFYEIHANGIIIVKKGYAYDGPSGPTFDSRCSMRAALGHDVVYQAMREGLLDWRYKRAIDDNFYEWLIVDGMWRWRAARWYDAVSKFGGAEKDNPYKEFSAPDENAVSIDSSGNA
jgi:hypothetical protein